jgi:hypothetical protein
VTNWAALCSRAITLVSIALTRTAAGAPGDASAPAGRSALRSPVSHAQATRRAPTVLSLARAAATLSVEDEAERLLARFEHEPSVADLQRAAAKWVGAEQQRARSWLSRVRKAPWLPELRLRMQKGYEDDLLTNANGHTRATDDDLTLEVELRWRLDRVVFDRNELYVSREALLLAELRRDVVAEATRLYFQRRRAQVELALTPKARVRTRLRLLLQIDELTSELDGISGGFFRRSLGGSHETVGVRSRPRSAGALRLRALRLP